MLVGPDTRGRIIIEEPKRGGCLSVIIAIVILSSLVIL